MPTTECKLQPEELGRYSRHLLLSEVGIDGQLKLKNAKVLLIGTGGLGSPIALYLAAAGVGTLGLVDMDVVDLSNLQRQVIHNTKTVGTLKVNSAAASIEKLNPFVKVNIYNEKFSSANAIDIARGYDIIIDGTDNFPTRYLVNDVSVLLGIPNIYGSIFKFDGQVSVFWPGKGPCYRCLYPEPPPDGLVPNCAEGGVIGVLPGMIGTIQANEAIKVILGIGHTLINRLLILDALEMTFRELSISRRHDCEICGDQPTIHAPIDYEVFCGIDRGKTAESAQNINCTELANLLEESSDLILLDVRTRAERQIAKIEGSIHIPLDELKESVEILDKNKLVIIYCKTGVRGRKAQDYLITEGFERVFNLEGGIVAWSAQIDQSIAAY
ncbi:MAG TPA: molybdopterin-synthase adenylyltransferase MoeB [Cellvibrionaceae bacterium]|nr:molybdopterin-synthase adenylyltransferase MoeB [Cellvibrionaceae bacterium]HNG58544.1 molybdopterin-synthase adenylyltransferase MoeB [Cellvibrionaceae bacterium]